MLITLTRGLGQSALSVVSLAMPGKWFRRRLTWAMGVYALVMSVGFMLAFPAVGALVLARGWRGGVAGDWRRARLGAGAGGVAAWSGASPRRMRELSVDGWRRRAAAATDATLWRRAARRRRSGSSASRARSTAWSRPGIGLFNESILAERGFAPGVYHQALAVTAITGLAGNFAAGAWADRGSLRACPDRRARLILTGALVGAAARHDASRM